MIDKIIRRKKQKIIAFQIDFLGSLKPESDSSLLIAAEFFKRNYLIFVYEPKNLYCKDQKIFAFGKFIEVYYDKNTCQYLEKNSCALSLEEISCLFIRQNPPFDMNYLTNLYLLEKLKIPIYNNPAAIRNNSEKLSILKFEEFLPDLIIIGSFNEVAREFLRKYPQVVMKPLYYFAGKYVELLETENILENELKIKEALKIHGFLMLQRFLSHIKEYGDKRVFIIGGEVVGAINRVPAEGNFLSNLAAGGKAYPTILTNKELLMAEKIGKYLQGEGIIFAGLDVIEENLIEINVTSPTGLLAVKKLYGINLAENIVNYFENDFVLEKS